ncbi:ABC transporter permease, partial [Nostoc sp. NIES-2111]
MSSWWLDLKLGMRMLVKYPGLALAGGAGIAVAVAIAAGGYSAVAANYAPGALPLPDSERLVVIEEWDAARNRVEARIGFDFAEWRRGLRSIRDLAAFQTVTANLIQEGVTPGSVRVAAMTASGFAAARVQPLMGRVLVEGDAHVAVVGEQLWRSRWGGNRNVLGSAIRLGAEPYTVVGVMPEGFGFPVNHELWVPWREDAAWRGPAEGSELTVFGRLAEGATLESAQAELAAFGARRAREFPAIYGKLRVQALPFPYPFLAMHTADDVGGLYVMQGLVASMLVLVCLNVAILVFTRTSTRQTEMAVRTALGASRGRIVGQMFLEALVLASGAAGAGVLLAAWAMRELRIATMDLSRELPYWVAFRLTPDGVLYALVLAVLAAAIIGIVPAWQATKMGAAKQG